MRRRSTLVAGCLLVVLSFAGTLSVPIQAQIHLEPIGRYLAADNSDEDVFDECAAEILVHDPETQQLFVTNAAQTRIDVIDIGTDPTNPSLAFSIDVSGIGTDPEPTSVAIADGAVYVDRGHQRVGGNPVYRRGGQARVR